MFNRLESSALEIDGVSFIASNSFSSSVGTLWNTIGSSLDRFGSLWNAFFIACSPNDNPKIFFLIELRRFQSIFTALVNDILNANRQHSFPIRTHFRFFVLSLHKISSGSG